MTEKQPHKHKDLIVAWANGAEIECYIPKEDRWISIDRPQWQMDAAYRIKKEYPVGRFAKFRDECNYTYFHAFVPKHNYDARLANFICWLTDEITLIADPYLP